LDGIDRKVASVPHSARQGAFIYFCTRFFGSSSLLVSFRCLQRVPEGIADEETHVRQRVPEGIVDDETQEGVGPTKSLLGNPETLSMMQWKLGLYLI
jgi:hypothetical protein